MSAPLKIYEKLGAFYLGRAYDVDEQRVLDNLVLYDSKDLVTHAVLVGMTGSGKTGLGVGLLEEAAIDQIPALVIDPKGDLSNLLLTFPDLSPADFRPWINEDDAHRAGVSPDELAAREAAHWKQGLAEWDQDGDRVRRLRESADFTIYTPGSDAGVRVSILANFAVPPRGVLEDDDLMRDRISTTATSILSLLGIEADPVRSREHILLTTIFDRAWRQGQSLDLGGIIRLVQNPPVDRIGVMDLDAFFPAKDRFELAMSINNLLAAPGFAAWMEGEAMDVDSLLHTPTGKPRISIFSISHLSDAERMFFVSLLLNQTLGWMRTRSGTGSLRAMLYIDEIFGFMPPVAEPPTKKPLLTLLKQARAFGLGLVLATQNPMDLDYKGLSNAGTWFIGRLQTDRDKQRVLDGLEGATNSSGKTFDRATISELLSNVGKRVFLMHNVHEAGPALFHTRWTLSYLSGPMTRNQIKQLMKGREPVTQGDRQSPPSGAALTEATSRPVLPPDVSQLFLPIQRHVSDGRVIYQPHLLGLAKVHFVDSRKGLAADEEITLLTKLEGELGGVNWGKGEELAIFPDDLLREPTSGASFGKPPTEAANGKNYGAWQKALADHLYRSRRYDLFKSTTLNEISRPGESERDFRIRLGEQAHEQRDAALDQLRKKYAAKIRTLEDRIARAEQKVEVERQESEGAQLQTAISWGATILSAVMGRKAFGAGTVGRAATAARGLGRSRKQAGDVSRAQAQLARYEQQLEEIEREVEQEQDLISDKFDPLREDLETLQLKPRRMDIDVRAVALAWAPFVLFEDGTAAPLFA